MAAAYVDTSISFIRGPGGDIDISDRIESFLGVPTVSTSTAVVHACRALGVSSIGVLTVYVDEVNDTMPTFFEPQGIRVARMHKADSSMEAGNTSEELGRMSAAELVALGRSIDGDDVGAIFIPCTAVRTLDAIEPLEAAIGKTGYHRDSSHHVAGCASRGARARRAARGEVVPDWRHMKGKAERGAARKAWTSAPRVASPAPRTSSRTLGDVPHRLRAGS